MRKQTKVERTNKSKLDPRQILGLRVNLPSPVKVYLAPFKVWKTRSTGGVSRYLGDDRYEVLVHGTSFEFTGKDLVDAVIC